MSFFINFCCQSEVSFHEDFPFQVQGKCDLTFCSPSPSLPPLMEGFWYPGFFNSGNEIGVRWGVRLKVARSGKVDVSSQMAWPLLGMSIVIQHLWFGLIPQPLPPGPSTLSGANAQLLMGASPWPSPLCLFSSRCPSPHPMPESCVCSSPCLLWPEA